MSKKSKSSQFPKTPRYEKPAQKVVVANETPVLTAMVKADQISLDAHSHIQKYLLSQNKIALSKEDLNAVLRLSQHLRVFGLLSAVGYINQTNDQEGKVRQRTVPVWQSLLGQLIAPESTISKVDLMTRVVNMSKDESVQYLAAWRKSLIFTNHWNFWARAYQED